MKLIKVQLILTICVLLFNCQSVEKSDADQFFLKGNNQFSKGNYDEALRYYEEAIQKYPEFADAYLNRGLILLQQNNLEKALESLNTALSLDKDLFPAYLARAEVSSRLRLWDNAEQDLLSIQKMYSDSSHFQLILGNVHVGQNQTSQAMADYSKSIDLDPKNAEALVNRGALSYSQGHFAMAKADFEKSIQIDPKLGEAHNNLGLIATKDQDWDTAIKYYDRAIAINPVDPYALNNKGLALITTGKLDEGAQLIKRSLQNEPSNGYALRNLGLYYYQKRDLKTSLGYFEDALKLTQSVENLYGYTGRSYMETGNKDRACQIWQSGSMVDDTLAKFYLEEFCR